MWISVRIKGTSRHGTKNEGVQGVIWAMPVSWLPPSPDACARDRMSAEKRAELCVGEQRSTSESDRPW